ncbi:MAG: hypothetical protein JWN07_1591, partial [Hyphomicrobiales bacterium]|nr:hypothetical protein [Hyphomicrobiales bacterium]
MRRRPFAIANTRALDCFALLAMTGLAFLAMTGASNACETITYDNAPYSVCDAARSDKGLRLFLRDESGEIIGSFSALDRLLATRGEKLVFAMNGGMYHPDRKP